MMIPDSSLLFVPPCIYNQKWLGNIYHKIIISTPINNQYLTTA